MRMLDCFFEYARYAISRPSWHRYEKYDFNDALPMLGSLDITVISKLHINELQRLLLTRMFPSSAQRRLNSIASFFSFCVLRGYIAHSPCHGLKRLPGGRFRGRVLSQEETRFLFSLQANAKTLAVLRI